MNFEKGIIRTYTIGEVSAICNVSKKALRYYDKLGVLSPDFVSDINGYRYYSHKNLLQVPILKYYKQMGFKLEEMKGLIDGKSYSYLEKNFKTKIDELELEQIKIKNKYIATSDWKELLDEARMVKHMEVQEVSVKYIKGDEYCYLEQNFNYDYMESIINIEWVSYLESKNIEITDAVILNFPSYKDKIDGECRRATIMQKPLYTDNHDIETIILKNHLALSVYHIGSLETLNNSYKNIELWAEKNGYICGCECYERYVVDYWTTRDENEFVTEILIPVKIK